MSGKWHSPHFPIFGLMEGHHPALHVYIVLGQQAQLSCSHAGAEGQGHQRVDVPVSADLVGSQQAPALLL
jgi:hypothetical protein